MLLSLSLIIPNIQFSVPPSHSNHSHHASRFISLSLPIFLSHTISTSHYITLSISFSVPPSNYNPHPRSFLFLPLSLHCCFLFARFVNKNIHCKDMVPKIRNKSSQKWNWAVSFPVPTFMYLWEIYIFPRSVHLADGSWEHINRSQIHECGIWERSRTVFFLGIHKSDLVCSVYNKAYRTYCRLVRLTMYNVHIKEIL